MCRVGQTFHVIGRADAGDPVAGKAGDWQKVLKLSSDMQRSGVRPDVWTYASLIAACQSCGNRWREALAFYQDMQDKGEVLLHCKSPPELLLEFRCTTIGCLCWQRQAVCKQREGTEALVEDCICKFISASMSAGRCCSTGCSVAPYVSGMGRG